MNHEHRSDKQYPRTGWVLLGFFAVAAFFLMGEHRAHALGALPFLLLLACLLMHIFMHRDHKGGDRHD